MANNDWARGRPAAALMQFLVPGLLACAPACAGVGPASPSLHQRLLVLDSHLDTPAHLDDPKWSILERHGFAADGSQVDLPRMRQGGLDGGFWVTFTPQGPLDAQGYARAHAHAITRSRAIRDMVERHAGSFTLAEQAADAKRIAAQGRMIVYQSMENAYPLGEDVASLAAFRHLGVRMLGIVHMANNQFGDSANDPTGARWQGLSALGRDLVHEANRLGMLIDLSHASDDVFDQVLTLSATPVILSHSGCRALYDRPRNIDDERIKRLAARGGVIQVTSIYMVRTPPDPARDAAVAKLLAEFGSTDSKDRQAEFEAARAALNAKYPVPRPDFEDFMENLLHALKLVGPDHVGIGMDWDGGSDVHGLEDVTKLPLVTSRLLETGYSAQDIQKIWGLNMLRVLAAAESHAKKTRGAGR